MSEDDGLVHIPKEDYIPRKKWNRQIFLAFALPSVLAVFSAGGLFYKVNATEAQVKDKANKTDLTMVEQKIEKDIKYLKEGQIDLKRQVERNHREIIEILKKR